MKQNVTVSLGKDLIQKLRIIAAKRATSISRLLSKELELIVERSEHYENAKRRAIAAMDSGFHLGGKPVNRDDLHER